MPPPNSRQKHLQAAATTPVTDEKVEQATGMGPRVAGSWTRHRLPPSPTPTCRHPSCPRVRPRRQKSTRRARERHLSVTSILRFPSR
ncbi:uncharacterized protein LOC144576954 isoform X2 [Callithrix jacchus]